MWSEFFDCSLIADLCFINIKIPPENCPEPWRFVSGKMYPEKQEKKIKIHCISLGFPYRIPSLVIAFISLKSIAPRNSQCFRLYGSHKVKNVEHFFPSHHLVWMCTFSATFKPEFSTFLLYRETIYAPELTVKCRTVEETYPPAVDSQQAGALLLVEMWPPWPQRSSKVRANTLLPQKGLQSFPGPRQHRRPRKGFYTFE